MNRLLPLQALYSYTKHVAYIAYQDVPRTVVIHICRSQRTITAANSTFCYLIPRLKGWGRKWQNKYVQLMWWMKFKLNSVAVTVLYGHAATTCLTYSRNFSTAFIRLSLKVHGSSLGSKKPSPEYCRFFSSSVPGKCWNRIPESPKITSSLRPFHGIIRFFIVF
jgi:hypothetical protein